MASTRHEVQAGAQVEAHFGAAAACSSDEQPPSRQGRASVHRRLLGDGFLRDAAAERAAHAAAQQATHSDTLARKAAQQREKLTRMEARRDSIAEASSQVGVLEEYASLHPHACYEPSVVRFRLKQMEEEEERAKATAKAAAAVAERDAAVQAGAAAHAAEKAAVGAAEAAVEAEILAAQVAVNIEYQKKFS